jgi:hypothetical protein
MLPRISEWTAVDRLLVVAAGLLIAASAYVSLF